MQQPGVRYMMRTKAPQPLNTRYDVKDVATIDAKALDTFPYEYTGKDIVINIQTDEFTAVCPWSGLPDFATVTIDYIPSKVCIELRSLKYYLHSYRNVGIYQEHVVNRIIDDLVHRAKPKWMKVTADYRIRGGVHTIASREYRTSASRRVHR
jgi:7-cyano-7-deazaguanine reductase